MGLLQTLAAWRKRNVFICLCLVLAAIAAARTICTPRDSPLSSPRRLTRVSDTGKRKYGTSSGHHKGNTLTPTANVGKFEIDGKSQLRVFVYDLPHRFTFGMIEQYNDARGLPDSRLSTEDDLASIPAYPAHQHASEWWLFQSLFTPEELRAAAKDITSLSKFQQTRRRKALEIDEEGNHTAVPLPQSQGDTVVSDPSQQDVDRVPCPYLLQEAELTEEHVNCENNTSWQSPAGPFHFEAAPAVPETSTSQGEAELVSPRRKALFSSASKARRKSAYSAQHVPTSVAVRVSDPRDAEIIFVPFFSSLSLIVQPLEKVRKQEAEGTGASLDDVAGYDDVAAQQALMDWVEQQEPWKKSRGRDHVFVASDPNAMSQVHQRTKNSVLLVADFGRLKADEASLQKDVVIPYVHRVPTFAPLDEQEAPPERDLLLFFAGNRFRKEGGTIRTKLFDVLGEEENVSMIEGIPSAEGRRAAMKGMRTSKFCLSPAGDTPSACRLFDAIVNLCVPVVVSDRIELPFEDRLDYSTFALFIPEAKALETGYLAARLREEIASGGWERKQQILNEVRSLFEYSEPYGAVDMVWDKISTKVPAIQEAIHREGRLVGL